MLEFLSSLLTLIYSCSVLSAEGAYSNQGSSSNTAAMDNASAHAAITFSTWLLLQVLTFPQVVFSLPLREEEEDDTALTDIVRTVGQLSADPLATLRFGLESLNIYAPSHLLDDDLGYWVRPRSTTWFSRFLLCEYDDTRWIQMFRMNKAAVFALAELLAPQVQKADTKFRVAIPVLIRVACTLFKLTHGSSLFICSELFAIGKSTVSSVLRDVVHAVNDALRHKLTWPTGDRLRETQQKFHELCGLPAVVGAIDGTHISIAKPRHVPGDYYYFKSAGYTLNCQAVVDSDKRFLDLYLGMPGSTNDSRMLRRSSLYELAVYNNLFDDGHGLHGFSPYLLGDLGYPLLPWLMVPHYSDVRLSVAEALFNKKLRRGRCVVENAFGILKQTFRELLTKSDLDVVFLPDVILCCAILHNMLLGQSHEEVQQLFEVLRTEGLEGEVLNEPVRAPEEGDMLPEVEATAVASEKRRQLGVHLSLLRQHQP